MATKKKATHPLSKKTEWTINEFKMWLHGAYSLQGEDWVPNADQWEMILDIIYKLKESGNKGQPQRAPTLVPPGYGGPAPAAAPPQGPIIHQGVSALDNIPEQPRPANNPRAGIPAGEKIIKTGEFD